MRDETEAVDLDELARRASAATPGPWESRRVDACEMELRAMGGFIQIGISNGMQANNFDYISSANPSAVLALCARLRAAEAELDALRRELDGLREKTLKEVAQMAREEANAAFGGWGHAENACPAAGCALSDFAGELDALARLARPG